MYIGNRVDADSNVTGNAAYSYVYREQSDLFIKTSKNSGLFLCI